MLRIELDAMGPSSGPARPLGNAPESNRERAVSLRRRVAVESFAAETTPGERAWIGEAGFWPPWARSCPGEMPQSKKEPIQPIQPMEHLPCRPKYANLCCVCMKHNLQN